MFKPLLRTLPSLSGNFTLACPLNHISTSDNINYSANIRSANLIPLQNSIGNPLNSNINLLQGKYEFDVSRYYRNLKPVLSFYESKKSYSLTQLEYFNLTANNDFLSNDTCAYSRDTDYEFGVKRIAHSQYGYQFMIYAPFYIDSPSSLPEYFKLHITYYDEHNGKEYALVSKTVTVNIDKHTNVNYIRGYLRRYVEKIDSNVLSINSYYKRGIYYGIDVENGGLQEYKYDNIGKLFIKYMNIMDFDEILNNGFKETHQVMRQIMPISFLFNINDFLTDIEKRYLYGKRFKITGNYANGSFDFGFYDFDFNYRELSIKKMLFSNGSIVHEMSENIMDVVNGYHEKLLDVVLKKNKVTPYISRWKLLYSEDDDIYITNANYSFSVGAGGNYGEFPNTSMLQDIFGVVKIETLSTEKNINNLILANSESNISYYKSVGKEYIVDQIAKYIDNHLTSWYNISLSDTLVDNEFNISDKWSRVINGYSYFKGILYNISSVLDKYNEMSAFNNGILYNITDIDYFGVFLNVVADYVDSAAFTDIKDVRYYIDYTNNTDNYNIRINPAVLNADIFKYHQRKYKGKRRHGKDAPVKYITHNPHYNYSYRNIFETSVTSQKNARLISDGVFKVDPEGDFISIEDFWKYNMFVKEMYADEFKGYGSKADGYELIDITSESVHEFIHDNIDDPSILSRIRISKKNDSTKHTIEYIKNEFEEPMAKGSTYTLFISSRFVPLHDVYIHSESEKSFHDWFKENLSRYEDSIYEYVPRYSKDSIILTDFYTKKTVHIDKLKLSDMNLEGGNLADRVFLDSYNLHRYIRRHNKEIKKSLKNSGNDEAKKLLVPRNILDSTPHKTAYIRLDSHEMIEEYYRELYKDHRARSRANYEQIYPAVKTVTVKSNSNSPLNGVTTSIKFFKIGERDNLTYAEYRRLYDNGKHIEKYPDNRDILEYLKFDGAKLVYCKRQNFLSAFESTTVNLYMKKRIYLLTSQLMKLFKMISSSNETPIHEQLYLLISEELRSDSSQFYLSDQDYSDIKISDTYQHMIENNLYKNKITNNEIVALLNSNSIDSSDKITVSPNEPVYVAPAKDVENQLEHYSQLHPQWKLKLKRRFLSKDKKNKEKNKTLVREYRKTHRTYAIYKYKKYFSEMFINMKFLPEEAQKEIIEKKTKNGRYINVERYSLYNVTSVKTNNISVGKNWIGKNCMYIMLDVRLDNSSESVNINNKYIKDVFTYINDEEITEDNIDYLMTKNHEFIIPLMKQNVFKAFLQEYSTTICIPENITFINNDLAVPVNANVATDIYGYNLVKNESNTHDVINITRYFSECTPHIYKTDVVPDFYSKPMIKLDDVVAAGNYQLKSNKNNSINKSFIIEDIDINDANSVFVKNPIDSTKTQGYFKENYFEYKHFNDNIMYNLEETIEIKYPKIVPNESLELLLEAGSKKSNDGYSTDTEWIYVNNSTEYKLFKNYVQEKYLSDDERKYSSENRYDIHFLFLFNKYTVSYFIKQVYVDLVNNENMYELKYTYTLK